MSQKGSNGTLKIVTRTWDKDTNGLFDYSTKTTKKVNEDIKNTTYLIRKNDEIKSDPNELIKEYAELLFKIDKAPNSNTFLFENKVDKNMDANVENIAKINNNCWYVCNDNKNSSFEINKKNKNKNVNYYLTKNDIIKFGRLKFSLIEVHLYSGDTKYELQIPDNASLININNSKSENVFNLEREVPILLPSNSEEKIQCRICYSEEEDIETNPMVHLCKCKGGINYAHYKCIKSWMRTKLIILMNHKRTVKTYYINKFNCEICKTPYPFRFKIPGHDKVFELIDIIRPIIGNYIILESLDQVKENNNNKYIHIITFVDGNDITIGRGIDADVKINDISVSRLHSILNFNFEQKTLLIRDCSSKFGTLVLIKDNFELKERDSLVMQIGRSVINAKVIKSHNRKKILGSKKLSQNEENEEATEENIYIESENFNKFKIFLSENKSENNNNSISMDIV